MLGPVNYRLNLLGMFGLFAPDGSRIAISSKKGMALIALVATARGGVRSRGWLQDILWGSRATAQAKASLRRELSNLRQATNSGRVALLAADHQRVSLAIDHLDIDVSRLERGAEPLTQAHLLPEFLEGLDIAGEEGFEDWLRTQRSAIRDLFEGTRSGPEQAQHRPLPIDIVDRSRPVGGFLDRPLVAVLPFANLTGSQDNDYLAEGIAEELIEHLSRLRWLPIVARAASFAFSSESWTSQALLAATAARYVVEGRLRGRGDRFGIAISVVETGTRLIIWTRRVNVPVEAVGEQLPGMIEELVGALSTHIDDAEMIRAAGRRDQDATVRDLIWRARWHRNQYTREDAAEAGRLLEEALARDPYGPEAIIQLADFRQQEIWVSRGGADQIKDLRRLAQRAIAADHLDGRGFMIAGIAEIWMKHTGAAVSLLEHAIELNPSLAYAYSQLGAAHYLSGDPSRALEMLTRALRLNMSEWHVYYALGEIAMARAMLGDWSAAIEAADQSIMRRAGYWYAYVVKIHALVAQGDVAAARGAHAALLAAKPGFKPDFIDWVPFTNSEWPERLKRSLAVASGPVGAREEGRPS